MTIRRLSRWPALVSAALVLAFLAGPIFGQAPPAFTKENRSDVVAHVLRELAREHGARTSMSDSGSGKVTSDMDVTCKLVLVRPDGTKDYDLTSRFVDTARRLYNDTDPKGDFVIDKYGCIQSKTLDTAVHDAKNAVPDFHAALPLEEFRILYMEALQKKLNNPDAYFTSGGNTKQVTQRMQSKSRIRMFEPGGGGPTMINVDREGDPTGYADAMKTYFDMNPDEVLSRKRAPDLFGDSFDAYRQATLHEHGDDLTRGDAKYNTRIIDNYLELSGYPGTWKSLPAGTRQEVLTRLFPEADQAATRGRMLTLLDDSFRIYDARGSGAPGKVPDMDEFREVSMAFQKAAISESAVARIRDICDPRISMRDIEDHAQALAQKQGKTWADLGVDERRAFVERAQANEPDLVRKLKFTAAGEMAMALKFLETTDSSRTSGLKARILANVPPEARVHVEQQMKLAAAYLRDASNRTNNLTSELSHTKGVLAEIKQMNLISPEVLAQAGVQKSGGMSFRRALMFAGETYESYKKIEEQWSEIKAALDPTSLQMAGALDKLDKAQAILNLVKLYQDTGRNDPEAMKKAVYIEMMSRYVPGYGSYQMIRQWQTGDAAARDSLAKSLVFQGLTMLPGGAIAQTVKLGFDTAKLGLEITIGSSLSAMGDAQVRRWLEGSGRGSILDDVTGDTAEERRKSLFRYMVGSSERGGGVLAQAYRNISRVKKHWESLSPVQKAAYGEQVRYQGKLDTFFKLARQRIDERVNTYVTDQNARGYVSTGSRDKLIELLYADFVNGLNREVGGNSLKAAQTSAKAEAGVLDSMDTYLYGLFSEGLDAAWRKGMGLSAAKIPTRPDRWSLRFSEVQDAEGFFRADVQAVPPLNPTMEEETTIYHLKIVGTRFDPPLDTAATSPPQAFKVLADFELVDSRTNKRLVARTFEFKRGPAPSGLFAHYEEYYGDGERKTKREEFDYVLMTPAEFFGKAARAYGRPPTAEERKEGEQANTRMVAGLEGPDLIAGLVRATGGDRKTADLLVARIGSGELWMLFHGRYVRYNPNGSTDYSQEFVEGLAQGGYVSYHANGKTKEKGRLEGNRRIAEWQEFDEADRLVTTVFYEKGEPVWRLGRSYHADGRLRSDGPRKIKNPNSSLLDLEDGPFIEYWENGTNSRRGQYRAGQAIGTWEDWGRAGQLVQQRIYSDPPDNERFVKVTIYDATGAVEESGYETRMGRKHGEWIETRGTAKVTVVYEQGRVVRR